MTDSILRRCPACRRYSLKGSCPGCGAATATPHPARFSPQDRWARYRRALYADMSRQNKLDSSPSTAGPR